MTKLLKLFKCNPSSVLVVLILFLSCQSSFALETQSVCFGQNCFYPEIARTTAEKQHGLMERKELSKGQGMLFVYEKEVHPVFWMKNMMVPLDFLWLDHAGKAVTLHENVPACKTEDCPMIRSNQPIQYVLEIPAGSIQQSKIKIGDQAIMSGITK